MKYASKKRAQSLIASLLTFAMLLSLLPTTVFALEPEPPTLEDFQKVSLQSLRDNQREVSYFSSVTRNGYLKDNANLTYPDSWYKLSFVLEESQYISLEVYKMADDYSTGSELYLPFLIDDEAWDHGASQPEEFLGEYLGTLVGVHVTDNVEPANEGEDLEEALQVNYKPINEDEWNHIVWETIHGEREAKPYKDEYSFSYRSKKLVIPDAEEALLNGEYQLNPDTAVPTPHTAGDSRSRSGGAAAARRASA